MKVAVLGCGAIGGVVAREIARGNVQGAELVGVIHDDPVDPPDLPTVDLTEALQRADLVVECAGQGALAALGPQVLRSGKDLLVTSVGALADETVFAAVTETPSGRVRLCTGAIGGLDLLAAAARAGELHEVRIVTTKTAANLVQPWMSGDEAQRLRETIRPVELISGPARKVTQEFPKSANVAASVALAVGNWDVVEAAVVGDPDATLTSHVITADGAAGSYRFEIRNHPSERTPTTSGVVPYAVLHAIEALSGETVVFR